MTVECLQLFTEAGFVGEWGMKYIPTTHLTCVQHEQLSGNNDPVETEYPSISLWKLIFFSSIIDVALPHLSPSFLHVTKSHSCQAEQRFGLSASTCGSGLGRCDTVLFSFLKILLL